MVTKAKSTIAGNASQYAMFKLTHGHPKEAVEDFQRAANLVKRDTGLMPEWLTSRLDIAAAEAAKQNGR